jgi:hypothetical protein
LFDWKNIYQQMYEILLIQVIIIEIIHYLYKLFCDVEMFRGTVQAFALLHISVGQLKIARRKNKDKKLDNNVHRI